MYFYDSRPTDVFRSELKIVCPSARVKHLARKHIHRRVLFHINR